MGNLSEFSQMIPILGPLRMWLSLDITDSRAVDMTIEYDFINAYVSFNANIIAKIVTEKLGKSKGIKGSSIMMYIHENSAWRHNFGCPMFLKVIFHIQ
jgi:hypothetical protein